MVATLTLNSGNISSFSDVASVRTDLISKLNNSLTGITAAPDSNAANFPEDIILTAATGTSIGAVVSKSIFDGQTTPLFTQVMQQTAGSNSETHGALITLDGNPVDKTYSVTIEHNSNKVEVANYVGASGDNLAKVQSEIVKDINAFASANSADIQASAEGGAGVKIVSTVANQPLGVVNSSHSFTNMVNTVQANVNPTAEVDVVTVVGTPAVGDVFTISVGGTNTSVNVTDGSISTVADVQAALVTLLTQHLVFLYLLLREQIQVK